MGITRYHDAKQPEEDVARNLSLAQSAWTEADALRKATLALTQDLHMDNVLDTFAPVSPGTGPQRIGADFTSRIGLPAVPCAGSAAQ
jgi:hypothetical protein